MLCYLIITDFTSLRIGLLERNAMLEILIDHGQRLELLIGSHHQPVGIAFALAAFGIGEGFGEQTWPVEVYTGMQVVAAEGIRWCGKALRDVAVAQMFAYDVAVLGCGLGVVVAVSGSRFCLFFDEKFVE